MTCNASHSVMKHCLTKSFCLKAVEVGIGKLNGSQEQAKVN